MKPYRAIDKETGDTKDFVSAARLMDWLFAVGGFRALQKYWVFRNRRRVRLPRGGEVGEIARWLEETK